MLDESTKVFIGKMIPQLDEKQRRIFLGGLSEMLGRGSVKELHELTKVSQVTIRRNAKKSLPPLKPEAAGQPEMSGYEPKVPGEKQPQKNILRLSMSLNFWYRTILSATRKTRFAGQQKA